MEYILVQAQPSIEVPSAAPQAVDAAQQQPMGGSTMMLFTIAFMAVIYFVMLRPHSKREKERQKALKSIAKGDKIVTRGGIWGTVVGIKEDSGILNVKIAENVKVEISKSAVELVNPQEQPKKESKK